MAETVFESVIACPRCGFSRRETMPADQCVFFYVCESCGTRLRPEPGDCCVFCSFGSVPCPSIQAAAKGMDRNLYGTRKPRG